MPSHQVAPDVSAATPPLPAADRLPRRQRLLEDLQGRPLEQAYLRPDIRRDLEAEAADPDPDQLVTPEQLAYLRELLDPQRRQDSFAAGAPVEFGFWHPDRQAVIVPGFLGSELSDVAPGGSGLIWISPALALFDRLSSLQLARYEGGDRDLLTSVRVEATGPLPVVYDLLSLALRVNGYAIAVHPVDWRKDLELSADALVTRLTALAASSQPIHLIAHSQGALVARRALQKLQAAGAGYVLDLLKHLVLLGPANFGTFSAAFAIAGSHETIDVLRQYAVSPGQGFPRVLGSMSGLYQLLPWDAERVPWLKDNPLGSAEFWKPAPYLDEVRLARFFGWGGTIDTEFFDQRTSVILGDNNGNPTAAGAAFTDGKLLRSAGLDGDGTVPHSCAVLRGVPAYLAPGTEHWRLPAYRNTITAVLTLLGGGEPALQRVSSDPADHLADRPVTFALPAMEEVPFAAAPPPLAPAAEAASVPGAVTLEQMLQTAAGVAKATGATLRISVEVEPPRG